MSAEPNQDKLDAIERNARDLLAAVRNLVGKIRNDHTRFEMHHTEAERGLYAVAVLEQLFPIGLEPIAAAHDALGAAINTAYPGSNPVISLTTEGPA